MLFLTCFVEADEVGLAIQFCSECFCIIYKHLTTIGPGWISADDLNYGNWEVLSFHFKNNRFRFFSRTQYSRLEINRRILHPGEERIPEFPAWNMLSLNSRDGSGKSRTFGSWTWIRFSKPEWSQRPYWAAAF